MGNQGSRDPATGEVESPSEAEEAAILADPSLTDAQKAERMHVLEPKDRGRRLEDHFRPLDGGILGKGEHWSVLVLAVPRTCPAEQMPGLPMPPRVLRVRSAGHYGEVCLVERISDGQRFALKTIVKRKPIYVEILKNEVQILSVRHAHGLVFLAVGSSACGPLHQDAFPARAPTLAEHGPPWYRPDGGQVRAHVPALPGEGLPHSGPCSALAVPAGCHEALAALPAAPLPSAGVRALPWRRAVRAHRRLVGDPVREAERAHRESDLRSARPGVPQRISCWSAVGRCRRPSSRMPGSPAQSSPSQPARALELLCSGARSSCCGWSTLTSAPSPHRLFCCPEQIRKVLEAVRYLHDIGVIHRDLKPENILLKERGIDSEIKVIDFGLATYMKPGEMLRRHVGTPYYIAPEVLEKNYSKEADVWSLGVILYTLLCSAPPFFGDTEREIYRRIRTGEVMFDGPDWEPRSIACRDLVVSLLKKTPHVRLSLDGALTHRWVVYEGDVATDPRDHRTFARLFARLRRYGVFPILKKLVMLHIAHKIIADESRSDRERRFFSIIDGDSDGFISSLDLATFLNGQDADLRIEEVDWIVEGLSMREGEDRDASLAEFSAAVMPRLNYLRESSLIHEFTFFDRDSNGIIDVSDLVAAAGIDKETADIAIAEADLGQGEGGVDFGTFVRLMAGGERDAI